MPASLARPVSYGPSSAAPVEGGRRFGGAFGVSLFIHGTAAALLLLFTLVLRERRPEPVETFTIVPVAGEGNNYAATEAPAGHESGLAPTGEIAVPTIDSAPSWTPPAPEPEPTPVAPVTAVEPPKAPPEKPLPNLKATLNRNINQQEKKAEREIQRQRQADAKREAAEAARQKTSYQEWQKANSGKTNASNKPASGATSTGPRLDAGAVKRGVTGATGANSEGAGGKALTAASGALLDKYFAMMRERLRERHEKPGGLSDLLSAEVEFTLAANGAMTGVRIIRSSGNQEFDASVLEAFGRVRDLGPRPDGKTDRRTLVFRMRDGG